jgi:hypothetical protein
MAKDEKPIYISYSTFGMLLQLPEYIIVTSIQLDNVNQRLILGVRSEAIPDEAEELRPMYTQDLLGNVGENPIVARRLVGIEIHPQELTTSS